MAAKNPGLLKKWMYVPLCLMIVPALFAIIFAINCAKEPESVVASQGSEADANQAPAEPNQQPEQEQKDPNDKKLLRPDHKHPAFAERIEERTKMVAWQIQARDVKDPNVLKAMRVVPRHAFIGRRRAHPPAAARAAKAGRQNDIACGGFFRLSASGRDNKG